MSVINVHNCEEFLRFPRANAKHRMRCCVMPRDLPDQRSRCRRHKSHEPIRSFEELCDGKWDHLPESAFMYVGAIEEAEEQYKKMQQA